jgi:hypothetical protein
MEMNQMVLVSVDDHVCEPPDMFDRHVSDGARPVTADVRRPITSGDMMRMFAERS